MRAETRSHASALHPLSGDGRGSRGGQRFRWAAAALALVVGLVVGGAGWELIRSDSDASPTVAVGSTAADRQSTAANRQTAEKVLSYMSTPTTTPEEVADMAAREASLYAEDGVWVDTVIGDVGRGRDQIADLFWASIRPGETRLVEARILLVWSTGAALSWTYRGTPFGTVSGVDVYEMKDGVITRATVYYDL